MTLCSATYSLTCTAGKCYVKINVTSSTLSQETLYAHILVQRHNYNMGLKILLNHWTTFISILLLLLLLFHSTLYSKSQTQLDSLLKDFLLWCSNNLYLLDHLLSLFAMDSVTTRVEFAAVKVTAAESEIKPTSWIERAKVKNATKLPIPVGVSNPDWRRERTGNTACHYFECRTVLYRVLRNNENF